MLFYDIQDLQQIKKIKNYVLIGQPVKVLFFEPTNQIIVFYKNFITLQNIDNLQQCNIVQSQLQDKILPQVFSQNNIYYGISWQNKTISFSSYSDSISIKLFQQIGGFKYNQFGQTGNTITLITNDNSIFQYNLEQDCIIDKGNLIQFGEIFRLDMNQQQTKLLLNIENKKMNTQRLELIDFLSMKSIQFLEEFNAGIHYCQKAVFCEECSYLITAYSSVTIKLWDLKTCKLLSTFKSSTERIDQIQISAKGILAQVGNEIIKLWNLNALKQQQIEIDGHQTSITLISISQDGLQLASGSIQEIIRWDLSNFQKIDVLLKGNKLPPCFCFSNDCNYFAALDDLHYIRLWKLNTKYLVVSSHVIKYKYNAQAIKFNLENTKIIAKYENGIKILWNLSTEQLIEDSNINLHQEICSNQILFSYDSQYLVTFSPIQIINLFDEKKEKLQIQDEVLIEKVQCMAISHNNLRLAIQNQNCIFLWSIEKMEIIIQFGKGLKISQCLAFSNNDQVLFSINNEFLVQLWDVNDKYTIIKEISIAPIIDDPIFTPMMHKTVAYPLDEEKFFVVYSLTIGFNIIQSDYLKVCIIPDHEKEWDISSDYYTYHFDSAFSSKKQLLALQWFREFKLFETNSMKLFVNLEPNKLERTTYTQQLSFSKSGRFLLSLNQDKTISLWDLDSKVSIQQKVNTKQHLNINSFIFHQDEENIIVLGLNYQIYHDHISNYTDKFIFQSQEVQENFDYVIKEINQYTINYKENELKIIEKQSGNQICIINQFSSKLNSASFSPCGRNIILGMKDGSILFYKIDQETLDKQGLPTFFKCLNRFPLLMAPYCKLQNSVLQSKENENLAKLFIEKGAKI
ncbi:unnamed protein product [Paramecium sonneborni]|uniref:WD40-repeat-containing domain n=1 Tax=Paramecium sonneborni TaxID=65129 RepID=A0A8S1MXU7_9CILI|nr:unnamed protein product [Paramecium sonneborni]